MFRIEDNFYSPQVFDRILALAKTKPDNKLPPDYTGKKDSKTETST